MKGRRKQTSGELMRIRLLNVWLFAGALPCLLAGAITSTASRPATQSSGHLVGDLRLLKSKLIEYEPVSFVVTLHNPTDRVLQIPSVWQYYIRLEFSPKDVDNWRMITQVYSPAIDVRGGTVELRPNDSLSATFQVLLLNDRLTSIFAAGKQIRVRIKLPPVLNDHARANAEAYSTEALLEAVAVPAAEREAYAKMAAGLRDPSSLLFDLRAQRKEMGDGRPSVKHLERIEQFVNDFPDSIYSIYLRRTYIWGTRTLRLDAHDKKLANHYLAFLRSSAPWAIDPEIAALDKTQSQPTTHPRPGTSDAPEDRR